MNTTQPFSAESSFEPELAELIFGVCDEVFQTLGDLARPDAELEDPRCGAAGRRGACPGPRTLDQRHPNVIGGFVEGWTPTDEVHEYDPASDRWQRLAALPTARGALAAAV